MVTQFIDASIYITFFQIVAIANLMWHTQYNMLPTPPEASFGLQVLSSPASVSVCVSVCVSITCLSTR